MRLFAYKVIGISKAKIRSPELPRFSALCVPMDGGGEAAAFPIAGPSRWLALCFAIYVLEDGAVGERILPDLGYITRNGYGGEGFALVERISSNGCHAIR